MASPYTTLVGAPPHPKTFAFRDWYYRLLGLRIGYCAKPRPTNYYFAQAGNDSTGDGSQGNPFKTLAKAQALITAAGGAGGVGVFFNRGDTWTESAGLTDSGCPNITIGAWGPAGTAKPIFSGASSGGTVDGILVYGDGAWVDGIRCTNWGTSGPQVYPIRIAAESTNAVLISNCDADTGYNHLIALYATGNGTGQGGIVCVVGCAVGGMSYAQGTAFNFYADTGGQEFIVESCTVTAGSSSGASSGSTGVYSHTASGNSSLGIVNRLHCLAPASNAITNGVYFGASPAASSPETCLSFEIDTLQEAASGNVVNVAAGSNTVRINGVYNIIPANVGSRAMGNSASNAWWYNGVAIVDGTNVDSSNHFGWWNGSATGGSSLNWEHVAVLYQNWITPVGLNFDATWGNYGYGTDCTTQGCLFVANLGQSGSIYVGLDGSGGNGNAYFGISSDAGLNGEMSHDAHAIQLVDQPRIGGRSASPPPAVSQLYQSSQPPTDGVVLEYDAAWQPRNRAGQNVGSIEIVTANQLQAAQLVTLIANTENCCGGGSSTGAFAMSVTITDGTNPIPGAAVRISGPQSAGAVSTSSAGSANFALNSGSITVSTTATGYVGSTSVHTIDNLGHWDSAGSATLSIPLASAGASLSPGAGQTTAYLTTRDGQGEPIAGVILTFSLVDPQASADSFDQAAFTAASDQTGLLQILLRQSSTYQARVATGPWTTFTTGSATSFALPEILGAYTD